MLEAAERLGDELQIALATANLASINAALGRYPAALRLRDRAEAIHRRQGDQIALPYGLANKAELLIQLGRPEDASAVLDEIEVGIGAGRGAYVGLEPRVRLLRAVAAATKLDCKQALAHLTRVKVEAGAADWSSLFAPVVADYCDSGSVRAESGETPDEIDAYFLRERHYWVAAAALRRGDAAGAMAEASRGLQLLGGLSNDELRWRLNAVAAAAAQEGSNLEAAARMAGAAQEALDGLRDAWGEDFATYRRRRDLAELRKRVGHLQSDSAKERI